MIWIETDDFDALSWDGRHVCAVCGSPKSHEHDRVFRPPVTDDVSGSFDICEDCIRQAARALGLAETEGAEHVIRKLEKEVARISDELTAARGAEESLTAANVRLAEQRDALVAELDELNAPEDEDDDE